ncbi:hypothetical protein LguiB_024236 [Lonicera macranthoides]
MDELKCHVHVLKLTKKKYWRTNGSSSFRMIEIILECSSKSGQFVQNWTASI